MRLRLDLTLPLGGSRSLQARVDSTASTWLLCGPSGSGKSSLLKALAGVEGRARGLIEVDAATWLDSRRRIELPSHERGIGWAPQEALLFPQLSVHGNLAFSRRRSAEAHQTEEVLELLEIDHAIWRAPRHLSGGERQRVAIGRALLSSPRLLLLDEPFAALDKPLRRRIIERLRTFLAARSVPALIVSHDVGDLESLAEVAWEIDGGNLISSTSLGGTPEAGQNPDHGSRPRDRS